MKLKNILPLLICFMSMQINLSKAQFNYPPIHEFSFYGDTIQQKTFRRSWDGNGINPVGTIRMLTVLVNIIYHYYPKL